jgi:acetyl-CoA carboxylase biotin carboxyl carrier protein
MLTIAAIADLAAHAERAGLGVLAIEMPGFALRMEFSQPGSSQPAEGSSESRLVTAETTAFGTLLTAPPLGGPAFAAPGQRIEKGGILALLRFGPLYRPVRSPVAGIVEALLAEPGALVGYGQEIARLRRDGASA